MLRAYRGSLVKVREARRCFADVGVKPAPSVREVVRAKRRPEKRNADKANGSTFRSAQKGEEEDWWQELSEGGRVAATMMIERQKNKDYRSVKRFFHQLVDKDRAQVVHYNIFMRQTELPYALMHMKRMIERGLNLNHGTSQVVASKFNTTEDYKSWPEFMALMKQGGLPKSLGVRNVEISLLARAGRVQEVLDCVSELRTDGIMPDENTFAWIIVAYAKAGKWEECKELFKELKDRDMTKYGIITGFYITRVGQADMEAAEEALREYVEIKGRTADVKIFERMIAEYIQADKLDKMLELYNTMRTKEPFPNAVIYSMMIQAYGKVGDLEKVDQLHHEMQMARVVRTTAYCNFMLHVMHVNGLQQRFSYLYESMKQGAPEPDSVTVMIALNHYAQQKNYDKISEVWVDMLDMRRKRTLSAHFKVLIGAYGADGGNYVRALWNQMKEVRGFVVDDELVLMMLDVAQKHEMVGFKEELESTYLKLLSFRAHGGRGNLQRDGFLFRLDKHPGPLEFDSFDFNPGHALSSRDRATKGLVTMVMGDALKDFTDKVPRVSKLPTLEVELPGFESGDASPVDEDSDKATDSK